MKLQLISHYSLDRLRFEHLCEAQVHLENEIVKIIDSTPVRLNNADRLAVFDAIVKNKARLVDLLTVNFEASDPNVEDRNLLDMNL